MVGVPHSPILPSLPTGVTAFWMARPLAGDGLGLLNRWWWGWGGFMRGRASTAFQSGTCFGGKLSSIEHGWGRWKNTALRMANSLAWVPRSEETATPYDPTVGMRVGSSGGPNRATLLNRIWLMEIKEYRCADCQLAFRRLPSEGYLAHKKLQSP